MRFIHTADWHLGRLFHGIHLTDDQRFALLGLVRLAQDREVDAVVIAGDIFDRAVPPTDAVDLLDEIVATLALDLHIPVVMIAGNHDSPARLEYLSGLARRAGVHVVGRVGAPASTGRGGRQGRHERAFLAPRLHRSGDRPLRVGAGRHPLARSGDAMPDSNCRPPHSPAMPVSVLVGHAFVSGCRESESERPLSVGGSGAVTPSTSSTDFDYVALGHLHEPQRAGSDRCATPVRS